MLYIDLLVAAAESFALRCTQRFLSFLGEAVDVHIRNLFAGGKTASATILLRRYAQKVPLADAWNGCS